MFGIWHANHMQQITTRVGDIDRKKAEQQIQNSSKHKRCEKIEIKTE